MARTPIKPPPGRKITGTFGNAGERITKENRFASNIERPPLPQADESSQPSMARGIDEQDQFVLEAPESGLQSAPQREQDQPRATPNVTAAPLTAPSAGATPPYVRTPIEPGWFRLGMPSKCVPYPFSEVSVRPLQVRDLAGLAAAHKADNYSAFLDVLDQCISVDIRDLTGPDQRYFMYWLRLNSYPKSPYEIFYYTRYGHENKYEINNTNLDIVELKMTKEQFAAYQALGIVFPTVRDAEMLQEDMSEDVRWLMDRAQYVYGDPEAPDLAADKIARLEAGGMPLLEAIREFNQSIQHGVNETADLTDPQYEPIAAQTYLRNQSATLKLLAASAQEEYLSGGDPVHPDQIIALIDRAEEYDAEVKQISELLEAGQRPVARKEVVPLKIEVLSFFPEI